VERGFTLIVCVILMSLLTMVAVGLMTLASLELRKTVRLESMAVARSNARLALMQAIGQLQRTMGPDQRVSAAAEILRSDVEQPHWTGVWRTTLKNGDPIFTRDDLNGGLRDERREQRLDPAGEVMEWLVSGNEDPAGSSDAADGKQVSLYRTDSGTGVSVPQVAVSGPDGKTSGHLAWWTGDLGVRANLRTNDPRAGVVADRKSPGDGGLYRVMTSQAADMKLMEGGVDMENKNLQRMVSSGTMAFSGAGKDWSDEHSLDFTTESGGVLADVVNGRLKQDLTAYFENGAVAPFMNLPGLKDDDSLVGADKGDPADASGAEGRYAKAGPRFGLLRDWARLGVPFSGKNVEGRLPEFDKSAARESASRALANEQPVKLAGNAKAGLQPILVEATNFTQIGTYVERVEATKTIYQIRQLMYPRVVLWNPYNCDLRFGRSIIMMQGNGRQEMWTRNVNSSGNQFDTQWLNFEGGRSASFGGVANILNSEGYNDPYMGSYYFSIPETTFGPGECLVFSPARAGEYDGFSAYRPGP